MKAVSRGSMRFIGSKANSSMTASIYTVVFMHLYNGQEIHVHVGLVCV